MEVKVWDVDTNKPNDLVEELTSVIDLSDVRPGDTVNVTLVGKTK